MLFRTLLLTAVLACAAAPTPQPPLLVSAAISLSDALQEIARQYERSGGGPVRFNFGGSNVLARQIANGAPVDIFISADLVQMHHIERAGAIKTGAFSSLLSNQLVVIVPAGRRLEGNTARALADGRIRRIALGDPAAVPAGFYARKFLQHEGLWDALQPKLLPLANVRAALAAVENAGADAGIVYLSDVASTSKVSIAFTVPSQMSGPIIYPAAILERSKNKASAERFMRFLQSPDARKIFTEHKFSPYVSTH